MKTEHAQTPEPPVPNGSAPVSSNNTPVKSVPVSLSPTKLKGDKLSDIQTVFSDDADLSRASRDRLQWILTNAEALFNNDLSDDDWKPHADKIAGALAMLRKEWIELEDKRRLLTGGRKRRKAQA